MYGCIFIVIQAKQQGVEVAVQVGEGKISEELLSDPLTTRESECSLVCLAPEHHTIHAHYYDSHTCL